MALKKYEEALEAFESCIDLENDSADHYGRGQALIGLERYQEALDAFEKAISLSKSGVDPEIYHGKGVAYARLAEQAFEAEKWAKVSWNREASSINTDTLVEGYEAVRKNLITNPTIINEIARCFEVLANDPEVSESIIFDAARAAQTLHERAKLYAEIQTSKPDTDSTLRKLSALESDISESEPGTSDGFFIAGG